MTGAEQVSLTELRKVLGFGKGWSDKALDNGLPAVLEGNCLMVTIEDAARYFARACDLEQPVLPPSQEAEVVAIIEASIRQRLCDRRRRNN